MDSVLLYLFPKGPGKQRGNQGRLLWEQVELIRCKFSFLTAEAWNLGVYVVAWLSNFSIHRGFSLILRYGSDFTFTFHFHALEKEMATHSSVLAWRMPGTGEPGGLPFMGSHRVGHDWSDLAAAAACCCSVTQLCPTPCDPMGHSMRGFPVLHHLLELAQTHVHWVRDTIQPSRPLSSPFPPAFHLSQHQGIFYTLF